MKCSAQKKVQDQRGRTYRDRKHCKNCKTALTGQRKAWLKEMLGSGWFWLVYGGQLRLGSFSAFCHPGVDFNSYLTACIFSGGSVHPFPLVLLWRFQNTFLLQRLLLVHTLRFNHSIWSKDNSTQYSIENKSDHNIRNKTQQPEKNIQELSDIGDLWLFHLETEWSFPHPLLCFSPHWAHPLLCCLLRFSHPLLCRLLGFSQLLSCLCPGVCLLSSFLSKISLHNVSWSYCESWDIKTLHNLVHMKMIKILLASQSFG